MKKELYKKIGVIALILGILSSLSYWYAHFYISYFSAIGIIEWFSSFCLSLILILAGLFLLNIKEIGVLLLKGFIFGTYLDRIISIILWYENITITEIINPILLTLPFVFIIFWSKKSEHFIAQHKKSDFFLIAALILLIISLPKMLL